MFDPGPPKDAHVVSVDELNTAFDALDPCRMHFCIRRLPLGKTAAQALEEWRVKRECGVSGV